MTTQKAEKTYKMKFQPAAWVPKQEADFALSQYKELYEVLVSLARKDTSSKRAEINYRAIEIFCTHEELRDVWETKNKTGYDGTSIMGSFGGMFFGYHLGPRITETVRNKRLRNIDKLLKEVANLSISDNSVNHYIGRGLLETFCDSLKDYSTLNPEIGKLPSRFPPLMCSPNMFFSRMREKIKECKTKTHAEWPASIGDSFKSERVFFIHRVSGLVDFIHSYKRSNHAMASRILNKIRPDLGHFSADNIRLVTKDREKTKSIKKKIR
ncbi:MAG: hypothetical protein L6Q57_08835 [Alphaproteobacteria bacterium]|nr:hypothetical protein [Alphaproteobacteria bacterium]